MNITESANVQILLGWLLDPHSPEQAEVAARAATAYLAERARATLGAGAGGYAVEAGWRSMLTRCAGCATCTDPGQALDLDPFSGAGRISTDEWGVHVDAEGRGYVLVDVEGEARFLPRSDPHEHAEGPDSPVTLIRSPECGAGRHSACTGRAWWQVEAQVLECECRCHEDAASDAVDGARYESAEPAERGDDGSAGGAVLLAWRGVSLAQLRERLAGAPGRRQVQALGGAA